MIPHRLQKKILYIDILIDQPRKRRWINKHVYRGSSYADVTRKEFGFKKNQWVVIDPSRQSLPPDFAQFSGIVIGGSLKDPYHPARYDLPWMKSVYSFIRKANKKNMPILGICGGLQFTVKALGGKIIVNPKGREFGNINMTLTSTGKKDPLFKGIAKKFATFSMHRCMAKGLRRGWKLLASSNRCTVQAIAIGKNIRLVQFHPEIPLLYLRRSLLTRKDLLIGEGHFKNAKELRQFLRTTKDASQIGRKILKNFLTYFVEHHR